MRCTEVYAAGRKKQESRCAEKNARPVREIFGAGRHALVSENARGRKAARQQSLYASPGSSAHTGGGKNNAFPVNKNKSTSRFLPEEEETMKRITITLIVTLTVAMLVYAQARTPQVTSPALPISKQADAFQANQKIKFPKISISLTFGRAKKNCGGWGICKITLGKLTAARTVPAELSRAEDGKLELRVLERASEEGPTLFVDEDIPLSAEIARQLGVKNATIQRGEYAFSASKSRLNARLAK